MKTKIMELEGQEIRMIIEIPNENSIVKWKNAEKDEWKVAEISDLIKAYERPKKEIVPVCKVTFDKEQLQELVDKKVAEMIERPQDIITEEDIQNAIKAGYENGYSMAQAKYQRPQGEWLEKIIELFNKYNILLVHVGGEVVPVKNSTKKECYNLLYEIQELIEWRKILFNKNLNDVYKKGEQNA